MATKILVGNNMIKLRELEDESIDCIVTSPPYFGLRDYGTGKWEGGDPNCDHLESKKLKRDVSGGVGGKDLGTRGKQPSTSSSVSPTKPPNAISCCTLAARYGINNSQASKSYNNNHSKSLLVIIFCWF